MKSLLRGFAIFAVLLAVQGRTEAFATTIFRVYLPEGSKLWSFDDSSSQWLPIKLNRRDRDGAAILQTMPLPEGTLASHDLYFRSPDGSVDRKARIFFYSGQTRNITLRDFGLDSVPEAPKPPIIPIPPDPEEPQPPVTPIGEGAT